LKKNHLILFLFLIETFAFGQTNCEHNLTKFDSVLHKEIYRVDLAEFQKIELIKLSNGKFEGCLTHSIWKTNKKEELLSEISQKIKIPEKMVEKLMTELKNSGYEKLKDCSQINNCIVGLDGTTIVFNFLQNGINQSASYWELESDYYYKINSFGVPNEVLDARKMLEIINNEIDLEKQFENFTSRLPIGKYIFNGTIMEKRKNVW
jgi:hypothetical protein